MNKNAFVGTDWAQVVDLSNDASVYGEKNFKNCHNLTAIYGSDSNLQEIPDEFAMNCTSLRNLVIPASVKQIGKRAFYGCESLRAVVIPQGVGKIGEEAFFECPALETIVVSPESSLTFHQCIRKEYLIHKCNWMNYSKPAYINGWTVSAADPFNRSSSGGAKHIVLISYNGTVKDGTLVFPAELEGLPVLSWNPDLLFHDNLKDVTTVIFNCHWVIDLFDLAIIPEHVRSVTLPPARAVGCSTRKSFEAGAKRWEGGFNVIAGEKKQKRGESLLSTIKFPKELRAILGETFRECRHLTKVEFPSELADIGGMAFYDCSALEEVVFQDSPTYLSMMSFDRCPALKRVDFGTRIRQIEYRAFAESTLLITAVLPMEAGLEPEKGFSGTKLVRYDRNAIAPGSRTVEIEDGNKISYSILRQSMSMVIHSVSLGDSGRLVLPDRISGLPVTAIADGAIAFKDTLQELVIPASVEEIGILGIYGCPEISVIRFQHDDSAPKLYMEALGQNPHAVVCVKNKEVQRQLLCSNHCGCPIFSVEGETKDGLNYRYEIETGKLTVQGTGKIKSYREIGQNREDSISTAPWNLMAESIRTLVIQGIEAVGDYAFCGLKNLESVTFSKELRYIYKYAFSDCPKLQELILPENLEKIYSHAFYNCQGLKTVRFPEGIKLIGSHAFFMTSLERITIPRSVETLGTSAFMECRKLREIYLETEVPITLGSTGSPVNTVFCNVSEDCRIYTKVMNFTSLANNCNHTTIIEEPEGGADGDVTWMLDYEGQLKLWGKEPGKACAVKDYRDSTAPWYQTRQPIKWVWIGNDVKEIGACAFYCCEMEELVIGEAEIIGEQAFARCSGLRRIRLPRTLKSVGWEAFAFLDQLSQIRYDNEKDCFNKIDWGDKVFFMDACPIVKCLDGLLACDTGKQETLYLETVIRRKLRTGDWGEDDGNAARIDGEDPEVRELILNTYDKEVPVDCIRGHYTYKDSSSKIKSGRLRWTEEGGYELRADDGGRIVSFWLQIKPEYSQNHRIKYQILSAQSGWTDWKWDGDLAHINGDLPITDVKIRIEKKKTAAPDEPTVLYQAYNGETSSWLVSDGQPAEIIVDGAEQELQSLYLTCKIDGKPVDCLKCRQHISYTGDTGVSYINSRYIFGIQEQRLEAVMIKLRDEFAENYDIKYCVRPEGDVWQDYKKNGEIAGTTGQHTAITGIKLLLWKKKKTEGK